MTLRSMRAPMEAWNAVGGKSFLFVLCMSTLRKLKASENCRRLKSEAQTSRL